jgi:hypothetical protein
MAASDPAREPVLERAMPADAVPGSTIPEDTEAEVLLQDGTWAWAQVTGQRKDRHGRWCVGLRWYASPAVGGREGWYLYNPAFIRRQKQQLLHLMQHSACCARGCLPRRAGWKLKLPVVLRHSDLGLRGVRVGAGAVWQGVARWPAAAAHGADGS